MIPKQLTTVAAFSATLLSASGGVSAFLIPPELSDTDIAFAQEVASEINNPHSATGLDPITAAASQHQLIELACPGCPVLIKDRHHNKHHPKVLTDKPNHLELDFKIDHSAGTAEGDRLLVNGFELFPNADPLRAELWAGQILEGDGAPKPLRDAKEWVEKMEEEDDDDDQSDHDDSNDREKQHQQQQDDDHKKQHKNRKHKNRKHRNRKPKTLPQNLGFGLRTSLPQVSTDPAEQATAAANQEVIDLNLQIVEVGNAFVSGIPSVEIKLLRDSVTHKLMIGNIETAPSNEDSGVPVPFMGVIPDDQTKQEQQECDNFLCRLLEGFREKVKEGKEAWGKKMGGCHGDEDDMEEHGMMIMPAEEEEVGSEREMPVVEIDVERIDITEGQDGTWEIVASPVQEDVEQEQKIKDLLDEVPQQESEEHGHHHGGMHRYEHSWGQLLKSITTHVLLPVLVGIVAGVSVSFIGMAVGTLIVALYRFFYRRGGCNGQKCRRRGGAGCKRAQRHGKDEAEAPVEEKAGLLNAQEPEAEVEAPPAYEDAKVAEEGEVKK
ncbi:hypothetical protein GE21DRAFT_257 [Neurospora crassa]|uniref:DUF7728 domain-containing protein n=1 Tax=Neurospora crassa (strain ATCC 24698 / 74-OR23-1A / CBS 708.71 / DSM 1257 / FGSC 987) TaxID=367110 RepID=Q7SEQ3_NEUCR|nr:hypothetical protein NCU02164 [Neurospora crassa OR74A]EAA35287.1 hypothetical protein NCU02164 [Neurospora crassa OR74A]KHE83973.1 hypothetical protein GE21DRAFT_257 [Neurospora crassa]|eukprot:XP_964523.1 hypothetical protein NCU02164 [Neurospora crassa OR74A]